MEENCLEFANEFKDRILKQREALAATRSSPLLNVPEQLLIKIRPKNKTLEQIITNDKQEPSFECSIKSRKPVTSIINLITQKWLKLFISTFGNGFFRLYPCGMEHTGWGNEDQNITMVYVFNELKCPSTFILEYEYFIINPYRYYEKVQSKDNLNQEKNSSKIKTFCIR